MAFTQGTFTIGKASSNYLTVDAAIADYGGTVTGLTGDLTWIIEADTTWNNNFNLHSHNGFTFKITTNNYHNGDVNSGVKITFAANVNEYISHWTLGTTIIEKIKLYSGNLYIRNQSNLGSDNAANKIVRYCILNGISIWLKQQEFNYVSQNVYCCLFINSILNYDYTYGTTPHACATSVFENNSFGYEGGAGSARLIITGGAGNISKANLIVRNNVIRAASGGLGSEGFQLRFSGLQKPIAYNNASSNNSAVTPIGDTWDPSSSGNIGGISDSEFESLIATSADFMKLVEVDATLRILGIPRRGVAPHDVNFDDNLEYSAPGKVLPNGGLAPTLSSVDIASNSFGEFGFNPIGCYNAQPKVISDVWEL